MDARRLGHLDRLLDSAEAALRTLAAKPRANRAAPLLHEPNLQDELSAEEKKVSASLMRVNHTGEVCAQALYQGQALTARLSDVRSEMEQAAVEEIDHLAWCAERLDQLDDHPSYLNPLFYALSFGIGATAGLIGDRVSLGFVAATEERVCRHLRDHQKRLPEKDARSRAIVEQMLEDEERHGQAALDAAGIEFPEPAKRFMTLVSKVMTETSSRF